MTVGRCSQALATLESGVDAQLEVWLAIRACGSACFGASASLVGSLVTWGRDGHRPFEHGFPSFERVAIGAMNYPRQSVDYGHGHMQGDIRSDSKAACFSGSFFQVPGW